MYCNHFNLQQNIAMDTKCRICKLNNIVLHIDQNKTPMGTASHPNRFLLVSSQMKNKMPPRIVVNRFIVKREHMPKEALYNSCMVIHINIMQERYREKLSFHDMLKNYSSSRWTSWNQFSTSRQGTNSNIKSVDTSKSIQNT